MGSTDNGTQTNYLEYQHEATSSEINKMHTKLLKPGVYSGGTLTIDSGTDILISALTALCETTTGEVVRVVTSQNATLTLASTTPYAILSYTWANQLVWYADFTAKAFGDIATTDVILGKGVFSGSTLTSLEYTEKTWGLFDSNYTVLAKDGFVLPNSAPSSPVAGSCYYNTSTGVLYIYDGTTWKSTTLS